MKKAKKFPHNQITLDQTGQVKNTWRLQPQESLIIVLDKTALPTRGSSLRNNEQVI
nr:YtfJ family protein [Aggregatibacter actinomycetemcomitans]